MAIEFYCPGCGKLMRTPDEMAGRKGKCPNCDIKVQIPASSVASGHTEPKDPSSAQKSASTPRSKPAEKIEFPCDACGKVLSVPGANAGKRGKCPHCAAVMTIPLQSVYVESPTPAAPKPARWKAPSTAPPPQPSGTKITFHCPRCNRQVSVASSAAGQQGRCPQCQSVFTIPRRSTVQPRATPARPTNFPATPGLTPLGMDSLMPLDEPGLTPLGPSDDPLGLGPLGNVSDPLAPANNPFGQTASSFPAQAANPYAAPFPTASKPKRARSGAEIATMVCAGFLIFYAVAQMAITTISLVLQKDATFAILKQTSQEQGNEAAYAAGFAVGYGIVLVLVAVIYLTILAGGIQMMRFKTWGLCLAACILTMLPCNCFCLLGLPIGIWGIVMLNQAAVRSSFG